MEKLTLKVSDDQGTSGTQFYYSLPHSPKTDFSEPRTQLAGRKPTYSFRLCPLTTLTLEVCTLGLSCGC